MAGLIGLDGAGDRLARCEGGGNHADGRKDDCGSKQSAHWRCPYDHMHEGDVMDRACSLWKRLKLSRRTDGLEKCRQFPFPRTISTPSSCKLNLNNFHMFLKYSRNI